MGSIERFMLCASLAACTGLPAPSVETTSASIATFDVYRTYSIEEGGEAPGGTKPSERTADVQRRMVPLVETALARKGYRRAAENADLVVVVLAGEARTERERIRSRAAAAVMGEHVETTVVASGSLVVDVYDRATRRLVWQGVATGEVQPKGVDVRRLESAVESIMARFPARP